MFVMCVSSEGKHVMCAAGYVVRHMTGMLDLIRCWSHDCMCHVLFAEASLMQLKSFVV